MILARRNNESRDIKLTLQTLPHTRRVILYSVLTGLILVVLACGGGSDEEDSENNAATGGDSQSQSSGNGGNSFLGGLGSGDDSCSSISTVAGIPGVAISAAASTSPSSDFAKETAKFFEDLIEDALSVSASSSCFFEVSTDGESGVWMAYDLSQVVGSDASGLLIKALGDVGISADSSSVFSANSGDGSFTGFGFESLPGINANAGGFLWLSGNTAVVVAGTDFGSGDSGGVSNPPSGSGGGSTGSSGSSGGVADPSGVAGEVNAALVSSLESSLGVSLELDSTFNASSGGTTAVSLSYSASPSPSGDIVGSLTEMVEGFGGSVDFSFSAGEVTTVNFTNTTVVGFTVEGILTVSADNLTATLQISQ